MPRGARSTPPRSPRSRAHTSPGSHTRTSTSTAARRPGIEPLACVDRIVSGRGGYCFHLNGALVTLLEWLQVDVTRHVSGVHGGGPDAPGPNANHLGITARLADGSEWFVDAGLGDGPSDPLPLVFGTYEQSGFTYELGPSTFDPNGWRFGHDPRGAFIGADFAGAPARTEQFLDMHHELSTAPTSGFVRVVAIMRRTDEAVDILRGCVRTTISGSETRERRCRLRVGLVGHRDRRVRPRLR